MIPFEPSGDARKVANAMWNQYRAFRDVGFTKDQATQLLTTQITAFAIQTAGQRRP